jgi:hypothetical protein
VNEEKSAWGQTTAHDTSSLSIAIIVGSHVRVILRSKPLYYSLVDDDEGDVIFRASYDHEKIRGKRKQETECDTFFTLYLCPHNSLKFL